MTGGAGTDFPPAGGEVSLNWERADIPTVLNAAASAASGVPAMVRRRALAGSVNRQWVVHVLEGGDQVACASAGGEGALLVGPRVDQTVGNPCESEALSEWTVDPVPEGGVPVGG